jgi:hypothetical protein
VTTKLKKTKIEYLILVILLTGLATAEEDTFRHVQVPSAQGELKNGILTFSDINHQLVVRTSDGRLLTVSYGQIDKISYEYTKKHRFKQGASIALLSPGTGIIVAFTKSKNHWLEIDFHDDKSIRALVLKLDKRDYKHVCDATKAHTGKDVLIAGKTDTSSIKQKAKVMESGVPTGK